MQLDNLAKITGSAALEQSLAILLNSNESLIDSIKHLMSAIEALNDDFSPPKALYESVNNQLSTIEYNANNQCELATQIYTLCRQSKRELKISFTPSVQLTENLSIEIAYINPIIKSNMTDTISQACFVLAHICHSLDALSANLANGDDVLSTLHAVVDLLGSLQAAYYISYITLTNESGSKHHQTTTFSLPKAVAK